jgi:hypothetical protein
MPRRSAGRVQASQRRRRGDDRSQIPGASAALRGALSRLDTTQFAPGAVATAYRRWQHTARQQPPRHRPGGSPLPRYRYLCCQQCTPEDYLATPRETLEAAIRQLPLRPSRELRTLVTCLDADLFARSRRDPTIITDGPWWTT